MEVYCAIIVKTVTDLFAHRLLIDLTMAQVQCYMEYGNFESGSELDPLDDLWVVKLLSYLQAGRDVQAEELEFEGESHKILDSNYSKN